MSLKVISYANRINRHVRNYSNSLEKFNYNFEIVGDGQEWKGFMTKINEYIKTLERIKEDFVCITDCYDVLACGDSDELLKKYRDIAESKILFSAETHCSSEKCLYLSNWWKISLIDNKIKTKYLNSGFIMGPRELVLQALIFSRDLKIEDDQMALCIYAQEHPDKIMLDVTCDLAGTICYNIGDYKWDIHRNRVLNVKTGMYPCFIHTPCQVSDMSYRLDHYGRMILGNLYERGTLGEKFRELLKHYGHGKQNRYLIVILVIMICTCLIYPKLIGVYICLISILLCYMEVRC